MDDETKQLHVVMLPWLAFGHLLPFLELSRALARRGHRISFVSSPRNLRRLPPLSPDVAPLVEFVPLPLPRLEGLPAHAEATSDVPLDRRQLLQKAFDALEEPFSLLLLQASRPRPDWIVHDFAAYWASNNSGGVPCAFFSTFPASTLAFFGSPAELGRGGLSALGALFRPSKWADFPTAVAFRRHEALRLALDSLRPNASGVAEWYRLKAALQGARLIAERSCIDFERDWFAVLARIHKDPPVVPVGLLSDQLLLQEGGGGILSDDTSSACHVAEEFLAGKPAGSVLYVALGSEARLSNELLGELALGLERSELPFLWALRRQGEGEEEEEVVRLPKGFEERVRGRGAVAGGWVRQAAVLGHVAVGGFLTHCGWGSVVEGLRFGRPLVMLPVLADQGLNARAMAEKGVGVEVERDENSGSFGREAVAKAARLVMAGEDGAAVRARAKEAREVVGDAARQESYVDEFVKHLNKFRCN